MADLGNVAEKSGGGFNALSEIAVGALRKIGELGVGLVLKGLEAIGGVISDGIEDARKNAQVQAQTAAVIKSTGEAAGVSAQHVADYASSLSDAEGASLFGDDQIQQSTNLLLTFTNIKEKTLDAATAISVDMAQALGGAPKDAGHVDDCRRRCDGRPDLDPLDSNGLCRAALQYEVGDRDERDLRHARGVAG